LSENQDLLAKIRWDCRRGMLELDFILEQFLKTDLGNYSTVQLASLRIFLENQDPDLFAWFLGYDKPVIENDILWVNEILARQPESQ